MTPEKIAELTALCEKAAPGPWRVGPVDDTRVEDAAGNEVAQIDGDYNQPDTWPQMEANAAFIAVSRTALPEILAELTRLTRERDEAFNAGIEAAAKALQAMKPEYNDGPSMHVENMTLGRAVIANRAMLDASPGKKG